VLTSLCRLANYMEHTFEFHSKNSLRTLCECSHASLYVPACTFMQLSNGHAIGEDLDEIPF
jgi:hypothetical protein